MTVTKKDEAEKNEIAKRNVQVSSIVYIYIVNILI